MEICSSKKIKYHSYYDGELWASKKKSIIKSNDEGETWEKINKVNFLPFLSNFELYNRLTRNGISNIINIQNDLYVVVMKKKLLYYNKNKLIKVFNITRGSRPLRQGIINLKGNLVYGDYWDNPNRTAANLYIIDGKTLKRKILLTLKSVRHIHFVIPSKTNENIIFIGTGDLDKECNIFQYNLEENIIEKIGGGNQNWRAVSLVQRENDIFWGTDAPDDANYIFKFNLESKKITKLKEVEGPVFYSGENKDGEIIFTSIVEYRNMHKAKIYTSKDGLNWESEHEWKKDSFSLYWFGFGVIDLIKGQEYLSKIYINLSGLKK